MRGRRGEPATGVLQEASAKRACNGKTQKSWQSDKLEADKGKVWLRLTKTKPRFWRECLNAFGYKQLRIN